MSILTDKLDRRINDHVLRNWIFKQTDGVTMGSPLGPTMANFCLSHFENQLLEECDDTNGPSLYARYVDDIFCVFRSGISHESFLNKLKFIASEPQIHNGIG